MERTGLFVPPRILFLLGDCHSGVPIKQVIKRCRPLIMTTKPLVSAAFGFGQGCSLLRRFAGSNRVGVCVCVDFVRFHKYTSLRSKELRRFRAHHKGDLRFVLQFRFNAHKGSVQLSINLGPVIVSFMDAKRFHSPAFDPPTTTVSRSLTWHGSLGLCAFACRSGQPHPKIIVFSLSNWPKYRKLEHPAGRINHAMSPGLSSSTPCVSLCDVDPCLKSTRLPAYPSLPPLTWPTHELAGHLRHRRHRNMARGLSKSRICPRTASITPQGVPATDRSREVEEKPKTARPPAHRPARQQSSHVSQEPPARDAAYQSTKSPNREKEPSRRQHSVPSPPTFTEPSLRSSEFPEPWLPNLSQNLQAPDLVNPFMLPTIASNPYWPFGNLSKLDQVTAAATAMRQLMAQQLSNPNCSRKPMEHEPGSRTSTSSFSASQLAAPTFEPLTRVPQTSMPSIPNPSIPTAPPISSASLTAALSAWYGQRPNQQPPGVSQFPTENTTGHCISPPPPPPPPPPQTTAPVHSSSVIRSMISAAIGHQKEGNEVANLTQLDETTNTSTGSSSSLAAMMAAAAVAMAGLCRTQAVQPIPGANTDTTSYQLEQSHNNDEGLNLSTIGSGEVGEDGFVEDLVEDLDDEDVFLRHVDKSGSRRRRGNRKRDVDGRVNKTEPNGFDQRVHHRETERKPSLPCLVLPNFDRGMRICVVQEEPHLESTMQSTGFLASRQ
ncbi:unnamed protein product [Mesocestoides corti]|uniref:Uncharacterized protein n=3 Tax=Mesocestoides corti TaxID=53468 RepID=A0A0R3UHF5_MESCO|nr:unnamed protein product [Mesocestoides corti]